jgi:hypothetical protein
MWQAVFTGMEIIGVAVCFRLVKIYIIRAVATAILNIF